MNSGPLYPKNDISNIYFMKDERIFRNVQRSKIDKKDKFDTFRWHLNAPIFIANYFLLIFSLFSTFFYYICHVSQ